MQRLCTKLRSLALQSSISSSRRLLHSSPYQGGSLQFVVSTHKWSVNSNGPLFNIYAPSLAVIPSLRSSSPFSLSLVQVRHVSSRERKKRRKPMTPVVSKVKKYKIKAYSSYKSRFRTLSDGTIRRWREGKNHNAHSKSRKSRRRLRKPSTVPVAYAKVMKKLNFYG